MWSLNLQHAPPKTGRTGAFHFIGRNIQKGNEVDAQAFLIANTFMRRSLSSEDTAAGLGGAGSRAQNDSRLDFIKTRRRGSRPGGFLN